jgi:hypothetical protein
MSMAALNQIHLGASAEELYSTIIVNRFPLTIIFIFGQGNKETIDTWLSALPVFLLSPFLFSFCCIPLAFAFSFGSLLSFLDTAIEQTITQHL